MAPRFHSPAPPVNAKTLQAFRHRLPDWYRRHRRPLPWRRTHDPYRIWVSEIMLQQTRVEVARRYYARWLRAFPTVPALARAPAERVLKLWEGLGYYARARNLHRAARLLTRTRAGVMPRTCAALQQLPGIGRYTAGAIASIAYGEPVPVVDGNVARVLARVFAIRTSITTPATQRRLWGLGQRLLVVAAPGDFNQAVMELGALICTPARPHCPRCPLRRVCRARAAGCAARLPNRGRQPSLQHLTLAAAWVRQGSKVLVRRRPPTGLLANLWELPPLARGRFRAHTELLALQHTITRQRRTLRVFACQPRQPVPATNRWRWITAADLKRLAFPAAHRRAMNQLLSAHD